MISTQILIQHFPPPSLQMLWPLGVFQLKQMKIFHDFCHNISLSEHNLELEHLHPPLSYTARSLAPNIPTSNNWTFNWIGNFRVRKSFDILSLFLKLFNSKTFYCVHLTVSFFLILDYTKILLLYFSSWVLLIFSITCNVDVKWLQTQPSDVWTANIVGCFRI